ncbi:helix-turn-helix domain-containing protein [Lactobacillus mulieris]|uniref:Helix-turn-helix domain-containing protein n=1 Tax=Lactobacillus mulieris TaxID=2508708 RepID=A0AAW5WX53_9LACO|nr:helix-turn-helix domain-containing protein [Lactobacillus mulieris]MCZ3621697.1 helix-turn-helix domain-containing protein [Lactobacillus mulieris]MCZ3623027.1 helix-turn-helix domain-containing protein [Lactobacillus mulieris]MCZ3635704.1 helix-turn-helix domain-containing protein [Lactobacillus mulieris]MCZ3690103.1 helix-turn-helix domain-containing protein [Lactobacillus mulieris]MCZ3696041.1 helix-turn-helix domain-containing protein [Lactobacillus mulieris]
MDNKIRIKDLVTSSVFNNYCLITADLSLDKEINSVTIMDIKGIEKWVHKDELLIIGDFAKTELNTQFIDALHQKGIAGIITKKKYKKYISSDNINLFTFYKIPIILIDDFHPWSDVIISLKEITIRHRTQLLKENEKFYQELISYVSTHSAETSLCNLVYKKIQLSSAIVDKNMHLLDFSNDWAWNEYFENFSVKNIAAIEPLGYDLSGKAVTGFVFKSKFLEQLDFSLYFLPILEDGKLESYFVFRSKHFSETIPSELFSKCQNIKSIFFLKHSLIKKIETNNIFLQNSVFEELIKLSTPSQTVLEKSSLTLGQRINTDYLAVVIYSKLMASDYSQPEKEFINFYYEINKHKGAFFNPLIFIKDYHWIVLFPTNKNIEKNIELISNILKDELHISKFYIGISSFHKYWNLNIAWQEALAAIQFAKSSNTSKNIQAYQQIGIFKLFTNNKGDINYLFLDHMYKHFILPLIMYDKKHDSHLVQTLSMFFSNNFSYTQTSKLLFIHINTLRARLKKIEELINVDFKNTDSLMNLYIAIRAYQSEKLINKN